MLPATQARDLAAAYTQTLNEMTTKTAHPLVALAVMAAQQNPGNAGVVVNLRLNGLSPYDYDRKRVDAVTADCGACATCGDGTCDAEEDCASCTADCGACATCGDGTCDTNEDCVGCTADCGACPSDCGCTADEICVDDTCVTDISIDALQRFNLPEASPAARFTLPAVLVWPAEVGDADICSMGDSARTNTLAGLDYLAPHRDQVWIDTFTNVARYGQERDTATLVVHVVESNRIILSVSDEMDDTHHDVPLTVKVNVPTGWASVTASQNGAACPVELLNHTGAQFALVGVVPDAGPVVLSD